MFGRDRIEYKSREQIATMRAAGIVVAGALAAARDAAVPGATTQDVDQAAAAHIAAAGATPSFLGYEGFPATICTSVNDEVVHGIPGERVLQTGDLLSIDCGAIVDGWHADAAVSLLVGGGDVADSRLVEVTEHAMWAGIAALATGSRLGEVGEAVQDAVEKAEAEDGVLYGIVEEYVGHGIGSQMHQDPDVVNFRTRERGPRLRAGMCLAVEPMITRGTSEVAVCEDDWTVVTGDGTRSAHWEHSVAILDDGILVLTAPDGGASALAAFGVTPVTV